MREQRIFGRKTRRENPYFKNLVVFTSDDGTIEVFDSFARFIAVKGGWYGYWVMKDCPFRFKNKGIVTRERLQIIECVDLYGDLIKVQ